MIIYCLENCPNCDALKKLATALSYEYEVKHMDDPEVLTDLRFNGCFEVMAPIMQINERYYPYEEAREWLIGSAT